MWFRKRYHGRDELRSRTESGPGEGVTRLPTAAYPVNDAANAEPVIPTVPAELRLQYRQTKQFKPTLGQLARNLVIGARAPGEAYSAYNRLRTQVITRLQENHRSTVAITSPSSATGNTLTAINLAIS